MDKLPAEVLEDLFLHVHDPHDLFNLRAVCKRWHAHITNEYFLNKYFDHRFGKHSKQPLEWIRHCGGWHYPPRPDYNIKYPAPMVLKGSGGVVVDTQSTYRASFPLPAFSFDNNGCSVGMWLLLTDIAETVDFEMRLRGFSLVITLTERSVEVICSHAGGLRAQAKTKVPYYRWFHFMITYSSTFLLHIHGNVYALTCTEGPLNADQLSERTLTTEYDGHLFLSYTGYIKYNSQARFADIQALPCALTACEIAAIVAQSTCIEKLDMGNYLINRWTNLPWYRRYTPRCVLF